MKTKRFFAESIMRELQNANITNDIKIDEREVFNRIDSIVNSLARQSFFENWKMTGAGIDSQFLTTWDGDSALTVTDPDKEIPSYFTLPLNYADLPRNRGIDEIWPKRWSSVNHSVVIQSRRDLRLYSSNMAGGLEGRLAGYPDNGKFVFTSPNNGCSIGKKYGDMCISLVVRDSSLIGLDAPYPIPADKEDRVIEMLVEWFRQRRVQPPDRVRDQVDQP